MYTYTSEKTTFFSKAVYLFSQGFTFILNKLQMKQL